MDIDGYIIMGFMAGLTTGLILGELLAWWLAVRRRPDRKRVRIKV